MLVISACLILSSETIFSGCEHARKQSSAYYAENLTEKGNSGTTKMISSAEIRIRAAYGSSTSGALMTYAGTYQLNNLMSIISTEGNTSAQRLSFLTKSTKRGSSTKLLQQSTEIRNYTRNFIAVETNMKSNASSAASDSVTNDSEIMQQTPNDRTLLWIMIGSIAIISVAQISFFLLTCGGCILRQKEE